MLFATFFLVYSFLSIYEKIDYYGTYNVFYIIYRLYRDRQK
ncbi:hypothetical protein HMPREF3182_00278 [Megasphaera hutchinsoni]|uniref:Uncharacterized protein n=1 Tax=Megasphaera hutchinsoni TaxID=1588748 RepID=A0A134CKR8_9FIRM|nr:hypothetical protein HMPREF3182_00278 [Megasphaera hutchinsoni]